MQAAVCGRREGADVIELAVVLGSVIVAAAATISSMRAESRQGDSETVLERV